MKEKIILFDLFDTLLVKVWFDYGRALEHLRENYFYDGDRLGRLAQEYRAEFMANRNVTHRETSFADQLAFYERGLDCKLNKPYEDVEWECFTICREERLAVGAKDLLQYLKERGYRLGVLSNSIFSAHTLKRYMEQFGILSYFDAVVSSADIGYRKPSKQAFLALFDAMRMVPNREIFYIGNRFDKDYEGALDVGLSAIIVEDAPHTDALLACATLSDVKILFESAFLYINCIAERESLVDGPGLRTVVYFQGCSRACHNCHNPSTWSLAQGDRLSVGDLARCIREKAKNKKLTISGGEPLLQKKALLHLLEELDGFDICLYTGGNREDIPAEFLPYLHYIKVGEFQEESRTTTQPYVGSSNQRFIDLREAKHETVEQ